MFVVMSVTATEAEIIGVKSHILAEGMTPHEHVGAERRVIAVVGEVGPRRQELMSRLGGLPGVAEVTPISRPFKLTSREFHPEDTVIRVLDATVGDGGLTVMAGPVLRREPRAAARDGRGGQAGRGDDPPRRRLQAADEPLRVPGPGHGGAPLPGGGARGDRPAGHHRGDGGEPARHRGRVLRHHPDRRTQHAELLAAQCLRSDAAAGDAQARLQRDGRGVADGRRVHRQRRQPERDALRAGHSDVRDVHAQHDGRVGGATAPPPDAPAGDRGSHRTRPASAGWSRRSRWPAWRSGPTG